MESSQVKGNDDDDDDDNTTSKFNILDIIPLLFPRIHLNLQHLNH